VEHAVAASDGRPQRAAVKEVGPAQRQPLRRARERSQVRVLGILCRIKQKQGSTQETSIDHWNISTSDIDDQSAGRA